MGVAVELGKREQSKAQNRQAILAAAKRVFAQLGYEATTVRDIIRGTELASGTFYNYFKSKEEVFDALQDDGVARFRPILREAIAQATRLEDFIRGALGAYFRYVAQEHAELGAMQPLFAGAVRSDTPEMNAVFGEIRDQLDAYLRRGASGAVDSDYLAAASIGLAREVGMRMVARSPVDAEGATEFCAALLLAGLPGLPPQR